MKAENGEKEKMLKISLCSVASRHQCKEVLIYLFDTVLCLSLIGNHLFFICNRTPIFAFNWVDCWKRNVVTCTIWKIWTNTSMTIPYPFLRALGHVFTSKSSCIPFFSVTVILGATNVWVATSQTSLGNLTRIKLSWYNSELHLFSQISTKACGCINACSNTELRRTE